MEILSKEQIWMYSVTFHLHLFDSICLVFTGWDWGAPLGCSYDALLFDMFDTSQLMRTLWIRLLTTIWMTVCGPQFVRWSRGPDPGQFWVSAVWLSLYPNIKSVCRLSTIHWASGIHAHMQHMQDQNIHFTVLGGCSLLIFFLCCYFHINIYSLYSPSVDVTFYCVHLISSTLSLSVIKFAF